MRVGPLKLKAQLYCGEQIAMGPGKADLLEAIDRAGSISGAGRALDMSYRRAWLLVDEMNRCWREKLVETSAGGGTDRGARLTPFGREILSEYRELEGRMAEAGAAELARLAERMREAPLNTAGGDPLSGAGADLPA